MARPKNQHPSPYIRLKVGKWMLGWEWKGKSYEFSTGYAEDDSSSAETCRDKARLAVRGEIDWPEDWLDIPAVARWIGKDAVEQPDAGDQPPVGTSSGLIELWRTHYSATTSTDIQINKRIREIRALAAKFDLITLSPRSSGSASTTSQPKINPATGGCC